MGPYVLLGVLVAFTVLSKPVGGSLLLDLGLCALAAGWMLWFFTLHPRWRDETRMLAVLVAGLVVIVMVLAVRDPWFGAFTPALYVYAFGVRFPWRLVSVAAVAVVAGTAQAYDVDKSSLGGVLAYLGVLAANALPMCGFAWFMWLNGKQNNERVAALNELSAANRRLAATLDENEGLQEQLMTQAREAGVLDERQRMAREIHDTLAQGLTGIVTQLQAAVHASQDPTTWRRHVDAAISLARESLTEARRSVHALRPESLDTGRLSEALEDVAGRWSNLHGVPVQVTTTGDVRPMRSDAEVALLRTAQEALANVAKHARASRVGVTLSYLENEVALDVRDDGTGFDPTQVMETETSGFGLFAMRQRIEGLRGTLQIESEPDSGTAISARVPDAPTGALT